MGEGPKPSRNPEDAHHAHSAVTHTHIQQDPPCLQNATENTVATEITVATETTVATQTLVPPLMSL